MATLLRRFLLNPSETYGIDDEELVIEESERKTSVLEEQSELEDISHIGPPLDHRSFNFGAFANNTYVLRKLVDLGVNFYEIEKNVPKPDYLLKLNFESDVQPYIQFLIDQGVPVESFGQFFTKNPYFFQNSLSNLQVRVNYLQSKKFTPDAIATILASNPLWLNYQTVEIDRRLGFFQRAFKLNGLQVRTVAIKGARLITSRLQTVKENQFELKEVLEFSPDQCKAILLKYPFVWSLKREILKERVEVMTIEMELPQELIAADPSGLLNRPSRMRTRHLYLKSLGKAQYDPKKPNYVSIEMMTRGDDAVFCENVAKTSIETFNLFLKTL